MIIDWEALRAKCFCCLVASITVLDEAGDPDGATITLNPTGYGSTSDMEDYS
jgi:hypothetical protein